ncbi:ABC transporter permease [Amycolatopsis sp. YIM 10]|uniref:ABC transporter permease n=1 Tax=Amycolatopsis sp. YIM 10 TaxID=2653857 RepID=UPI0012905853|nr:ABC transporter permease [Amycolatopsis sp. YIM 10]QFU91732.1 Daunorubicin/doxorubicin resistance ABC transporter permease protein DrrB [Amycolatopsis sp. YIM 10]
MTAIGTVRPAGAARHWLVLGRRRLLKIAHNPENLVDVTVQPVLFLVMFGLLFGGAISGGTQAYLQVLVPGLLAPSVVLASMSAGAGLNADVRTGVFDRFRSLPIARAAPLAGTVLADVVRYLLAFAVLLVTGVVMGFRVQTGPLAVLAAAGLLVLTGFCFCWIAVFIGMLSRGPESVPGVVTALYLPLVFGSNVFVPDASLPDWLRAWSGLNPVSLLANTLRGLLTGGPVLSPLLGTLAWLTGIVAVFFPLAMRAYRRRAE